MYALKTKPRSVDTELYQAPYMNISEEGIVNTAAETLADQVTSLDEVMELLILHFYSTVFTHTLCSNLLHMNYIYFIKNHEGDKDFKFTKLLVKANRRISDIS